MATGRPLQTRRGLANGPNARRGLANGPPLKTSSPEGCALSFCAMKHTPHQKATTRLTINCAAGFPSHHMCLQLSNLSAIILSLNSSKRFCAPPQNVVSNVTSAYMPQSEQKRGRQIYSVAICCPGTPRLAAVCLRSSRHMSSLVRDGMDWLSMRRRLPKCSRGSSWRSDTAPSAAVSRMLSRYRASLVTSGVSSPF